MLVAASDTSAGPDQMLDVVHAAVDALATVDLGQCGAAELDVLAGAAQRVRGFVAAADTRIARRRRDLWAGAGPAPLDGTPGSHTGAGESPSDTGASVEGRQDSDGSNGDAPPPGSGGASLPVDPSVADLGQIGDRRPGSDAAQDDRRARAGDVLPRFEDALARGEIDAAHVDAVAHALERLRDEHAAAAEFVSFGDDLLAHARTEAPDRFRRRCTDLARRVSRDHGLRLLERQKRSATVRRWWDRNGMFHLHAELDPEAGACVEAALDAHLNTIRSVEASAEITFDRLRVESFVDVVSRSAAVDARSPEIVVLIDAATLRDGRFAADSVCETSSGVPLPPSTVGRLACEADLIPLVVGDDSVPLHHGRAVRLASRQQRRAIRAMYRTCAHPDCQVSIDRCRIHHVTWWEFGGRSDLENLLPLCSRHHHAVHEGGWSVALSDDRVTTWTDPSGTVRHHGDTRDRPPTSCTSPEHPVPRGPEGPGARDAGDANTDRSPAAGHRRPRGADRTNPSEVGRRSTTVRACGP